MLRFSLLMAVVMVASTSTARGVSQCSVDTVPIQMTDETSSDPVTILSAADMSDHSRSHFHAFVTAVTKHVAVRLAKDELCIDSAESKKRSLLQFVKWPLHSGNQPLALVLSLDARPSGGCRITSPWIDLAFERRPVPWIRGVIRWNPRQVLADQAVLAGARNVPPGVAMPLTQREFLHFAEGEYANTEVLRKPTVKPIEARVPPDLLWLFRHSWQSTFATFSGGAAGAMDRAMEKSAERYTQLVIALIDHCFASDGADIHYNSILDVADLISLEQYKITTPIR
jgi:hypothetical protein